MADLPPVLTRDVGPFPLYAWAGVIGGGVALGLVLRRRSAGKQGAGALPEMGTVTPTGPTSGGSPATRIPQSSPGGTTNTTTGERVPPQTNLDWLREAIAALIEAGVDPVEADIVVRRYINGDSITAGQAVWLSTAIRLVGPPPEYVQPPDVAATPPAIAQPAPSAPAPGAGKGAVPVVASTDAPPAGVPDYLVQGGGKQIRVHVMMSGETLSEVAYRYFGNAYRWPELFDLTNFLRGTSGEAPLPDPHNIPPGTRIAIPV